MIPAGGPRRWTRRQFLYRAGDRIQAFYKITKGIVVESRTLDDGRRQIVGIRSTGDLCGYPGYGSRYAFDAEALTDVEACHFKAEVFVKLLGDHVDLACAMADDVSGRFTRAAESVVALGELNAVERVAHLLLELSELHIRRENAGGSMNLYLTRREIGDCLGLTLETVSRAFGRLRKMRVIARVGTDAVAILDHDRLRSLVHR